MTSFCSVSQYTLKPLLLYSPIGPAKSSASSVNSLFGYCLHEVKAVLGRILTDTL